MFCDVRFGGFLFQALRYNRPEVDVELLVLPGPVMVWPKTGVGELSGSTGPATGPSTGVAFLPKLMLGLQIEVLSSASLDSR